VFDATYFRSGLQAHAEAAGAEATVEVHLTTGQTHRVRSVEEVRDNYVVLEVYRRRGDSASTEAHWLGATRPESPAVEAHRAVIAYQSITQLVITPAEGNASARIGFGSR
jgi:hypothetical protein